MRWFLGLNFDAPHYDAYARMVQAAVLSRPPEAGLEPHLLFDGPECELTRWFRAQGGEVIFRETFLKPYLARAAADPATPRASAHGNGVYLRTEIPDIIRENDWPDAAVLYTDNDVLFTPRFRAADLPRPTRPITVAPESNELAEPPLNSGFMVYDLAQWWPVHREFKRFLLADLPQALRHDWDQHSFRGFFGRDVHWLDSTWNWLAYWDANPEARLLHFHGPKPFLRDSLRDGTALPVQRKLATPAFWSACERYDQLLASAGLPPE